MKTKTREQAEQMKEKAAEFMRRVGDDEKADDFEAMSVDEYVEHKGIALSNPGKAPRMAKPSLRQQIEELQAENDELTETVEEYEARFDDIASSLPEVEEEEEENGDGGDED